jgi:ABC-type transporter Mla maintaining outer membrane lipid asymmetry permease subunit MlaE
LILICLTAASDIGTAYLLTTRTPDGVSSYVVESVVFAFASIITTAILLRVIEVRKSKSGENI